MLIVLYIHIILFLFKKPENSVKKRNFVYGYEEKID